MAGLVDYGVESDDEVLRTDSPHRDDGGRSQSGKGKSLQLSSHSRNGRSSDSSEVPMSKKDTRDKSSRSKKDRHRNRSRSRSRSKDRTRDRHSRRRRSRSRDRRGRDDRRKKRSKSRSRSRSRSSGRGRREPRRTRSQERREKKAAAIARMGLDVTGLAASVAATAASGSATDANKSHAGADGRCGGGGGGGGVPEPATAVYAAAQKLVQNQVEQAKQLTGVSLPAFYNPGVVNPIKYAQQIQKRKLLWGNKEKQETPATAKIWGATAFNQDQDGKMSAKFKRLMGIKDDCEAAAGGSGVDAAPVESSAEVLKKQQELFATLDQQYEVARAATHTQRGVGLGFSSNHCFPR